MKGIQLVWGRDDGCHDCSTAPSHYSQRWGPVRGRGRAGSRRRRWTGVHPVRAVQRVGCRRRNRPPARRGPAASLIDVAAAFAVSTVTLWRWSRELDTSGAAGLASDKRGPRGPSRLTPELVADIRGRRNGGGTLQAVADAVGVSVTTVRRALAAPAAPTPAAPTREDRPQPPAAAAELLVLPPPADRDGERAAARWGKLPHAEPVFTPAARGYRHGALEILCVPNSDVDREFWLTLSPRWCSLDFGPHLAPTLDA
jgi:hypothetical protein